MRVQRILVWLTLVGAACAEQPAARTLRVVPDATVSLDNFGVLAPSVGGSCRFVSMDADHVVRVLDRSKSRFLLASRASDGRPANGGSGSDSQLSADGTVVVFSSRASNLAPGESGWTVDVFAHDLGSGETARASQSADGRPGDRASTAPRPSSDGRKVAFQSAATNLVPGDRNGVSDVFVHDLESGETERVSTAWTGGDANGPSRTPALDGAGRFAAFSSDASNLVADDHNGARDVFFRDLDRATTTRLSVGPGGLEADGDSDLPALSDDAGIVAFASEAANLVDGDANGVRDVFVRDLSSGVTTRVSLSSRGEPGDGASDRPALSADGRLVAFVSRATNLVPRDRNDSADVFVHDRETGETWRASVAQDGGEANGDSGVFGLSLDATGRCLVFDSYASNLTADDTNDLVDVFVRELRSGSGDDRDDRATAAGEATTLPTSGGTR